MQCKYCQFAIGEDDHRCQRCGRRQSLVVAAPPGYAGANALAPAWNKDTLETAEFLLARAAAASPAMQNPTAPVHAPAVPAQTNLFGNQPAQSPNVIPFERWQRQQRPRVALNLPEPALAAPARRTQKKHKPGKSTVEQATLGFVPAPASKAGRTLKTEVPAQIFCDQPVATVTHRFIASSIDAALILIGFGLIVVMVQLAGCNLGAGRQFWITLAATLLLVSLFYGLLWAIAGRETPGMRSTDLHLITFDGFPVDGRSRALRLISTWLSFGSAGLGLLWAVADEERLTWHDHISKTFPTVREVPRNFVKARH